MSKNEDWYFDLAARTLRLDIAVIKAYCKEHSYLPSIFYDLVDKRKVVTKNGKIYVNRK